LDFKTLGRWARNLAILIKLLIIRARGDDITFITKTIFERFFNLLRSNLSILVHATTLVNYDKDFVLLVEVSFRAIREANLASAN
jgi:hypothetical protein